MLEAKRQKISEEKHTSAPVSTYTFMKEEGHWYIYLPEYLERGWSKKDLEMAEGAHKLLNSIANGRNKVTLRMSTEAFEGADVLELVELCDAPAGGAVYLMHTCNGKGMEILMWICDIALLIFGDLPEKIYVQRVWKYNIPSKQNGATSKV